MKKRFQRGVCLSVLLLLLFTLLPVGVMAMTNPSENIAIDTSGAQNVSTIETKEDNINVEFNTDIKDGFKLNILTAKRSGNNIVLSLNYVSNRNCDYSIFNPPNGDMFKKIVNGGIKTGTNTTELILTPEELNQMLKCDSIAMRFGFDEAGSFINFRPDQLKSLLNGEVINPTIIYLNYPSVSLAVGNSTKLIAALTPTNVTDSTIVWRSSDASIVTVDENGNLLGIKAGTATITATTVNNLKATCKVTVNPNSTNTSEINVEFTGGYISGFNVSSLTAKRTGATILFTLNCESSSNYNYSLFNPADANGINKGVPNGIKAGANAITIEFTPEEFNQVLASDEIRMKFWADKVTAGWLNFETPQLQSLLNDNGTTDKVYPTNITLNKTTSNLAINSNEKLTPSLSPSNVTEGSISWSSSDTNVVTVDTNGNISGVSAGSATITATTINNLPATCLVIVTANNADKTISYQTHVQNVGWQDLKSDGVMSGTSGESLRLEGIKIQLNNYENLGVTYQTHIQNIGWEADTERGWKSNGVMSGTQGLSYRLEAIQIKLTGTNAANYDIYYQVHAQNVGWMGWAKNGESAGTAGYSYRLEGIRIKVVPKGDPAPSDNVSYVNPFKENIESPYSSILQEYRVAEANGFSQEVIKTLPNVNTELYGSSFKTKLYYILEDISGDSSPELVIAMYNPKYNNSVHPNDFQIYDIYRLNNGTPERIFDIYTMGYRSIYTICENQIIRCYGSGGVNAHGDTFYKLNGNTATTIQTVSYDNPYYILNDAKNNNRTITKAEADKIINSYVPRTDINWIKL